MIVQISLVRNEIQLIKELLPVWSKFSDGFIFMLHNNTDNTNEYLSSVKDKYNILEVIEVNVEENELSIETDTRQKLFNAARKYTDKIICLDADEYLDGSMTKEELNDLLGNTPDTVFYLQWLQYTSVNTVRIDGPWENNFKDRIGTYSGEAIFPKVQMHSLHLPPRSNVTTIPSDELFIAHLQWMDKTYVAIKQYYWKVEDYVNNLKFGITTVGNSAYDTSVNNFEWDEQYVDCTLKISPWLFEEIAVHNNYRVKIIKDRIKKYNIPDLGNWGYDFQNMDETVQPEFNKYKISVITAIGSLDRYEKYISRWFKNAQDQHFYKQTEHIIVYKEWSEQFKIFESLPNFKLIKEEGSGMYNAWNMGIQNSTTAYITNWNIDDLRHPINTKLKFDFLEKNPSIDMVYNWYVATNDEKETFYNLDMSNKSILKFPDNFHEVVFQNCYAGPDPLWKKSLHDKVGYFDNENFATIGDWEMWIRFATNGAIFKLIPEVLCIYLDHDTTVSKIQSEKISNERQNLLKKYSKQ